ncbi:MAG: hypothetical protein V1492_04025 [Candidatus Micrarchaeota archaeon]
MKISTILLILIMVVGFSFAQNASLTGLMSAMRDLQSTSITYLVIMIGMYSILAFLFSVCLGVAKDMNKEKKHKILVDVLLFFKIILICLAIVGIIELFAVTFVLDSIIGSAAPGDALRFSLVLADGTSVYLSPVILHLSVFVLVCCIIVIIVAKINGGGEQNAKKIVSSQILNKKI